MLQEGRGEAGGAVHHLQGVERHACGEGQVIASCEKSLKDLQLSYIDLYFVHWPFPNYHAPGCDGDSRNPDSRPFVGGGIHGDLETV